MIAVVREVFVPVRIQVRINEVIEIQVVTVEINRVPIVRIQDVCVAVE